MRELVLTMGILLLGFGLRSFAHPLPRKLGALWILGGSFAAAYFLAGRSIIAGCLAILSWFLLPWVEILGRVRRLRLPLKRAFLPCPEPTRADFPMLGKISREFENAGFCHQCDLGWESHGFSQFVRLFLDEHNRHVATLSFVRQPGHSGVFAGILTRSRDGRVMHTTSLPFHDAMEDPPGQFILHTHDASSFSDLMKTHESFLERHFVEEDDCLKFNAEDLSAFLDGEAAAKVAHNLRRGLILPAGEDTFRFSWRGCFLIWRKSVADMIRLA